MCRVWAIQTVTRCIWFSLLGRRSAPPGTSGRRIGWSYSDWIHKILYDSGVLCIKVNVGDVLILQSEDSLLMSALRDVPPLASRLCSALLHMCLFQMHSAFPQMFPPPSFFSPFAIFTTGLHNSRAKLSKCRQFAEWLRFSWVKLCDTHLKSLLNFWQEHSLLSNCQHFCRNFSFLHLCDSFTFQT